MKTFADSRMVAGSFENIKVEIKVCKCEQSNTEQTSKQFILHFQVFTLTS